MKCANCGAEIKLGCVYCSVCGKEAQIDSSSCMWCVTVFTSDLSVDF